MTRDKVQKVTAYGIGVVATVASFWVRYPCLALVQAAIFTWMFSWGYFFGKRDEMARLEALYAKKHRHS